MKENYYAQKLSAGRLKRVYDIATPRIEQYLNAEIEHILQKIKPMDSVIELGCGYGRILEKLADKAHKVVGIDISEDNIEFARKYLKKRDNIEVYKMDAVNLDFPDSTFDLVVIAQNGISAFKIEPVHLLKECLRITKKGGIILFSTYAAKFWEHRLEWFKIQSDEGLLGEIDWEQTKPGVIICKDGFKANSFSRDDFLQLAGEFDLEFELEEIDESSLFCELFVP